MEVSLVGVDGCRDGWVVATSADSGSIHFRIVQDIAGLFAQDIIASIDVPIGLPDAGPRACDIAARARLPGQGSRVFPVPCRAAFAASSYLECCDLNQAACGKRLSKQTHAIMPKIREVDLAITPQLQSRIREAHPEVSFSVANGGPLEHSKKTIAGHAERLRVLERCGIRFDASAERARLGRGKLTIDDLLDATICLVTARRIATGVQDVLGDGARDAKGLRMEIIA